MISSNSRPVEGSSDRFEMEIELELSHDIDFEHTVQMAIKSMTNFELSDDCLID